MERSILCWSKCCKPTAPAKDEDEWIEPIIEKKKKKRVSVTASAIKKEVGSTRESLDRRNNLSRVSSVKWQDLLSEDKEFDPTSSFNGSFLSNPKYDDDVYKSVNSDNFDHAPNDGTLGGIRISDFLDADDFSGLDASDTSRDIVDERTSESSTRSKRGYNIAEKTKMAGHKLKEMGNVIAHKFEVDETRSSTSSEDARGSFEERGTVDRIAEKTRKFVKGTVFAKRQKPKSPEPTSKPKPITSLAVLSDGHFLIASRTDKVIKLLKTVHRGNNSTVEFVRDFKGHKSGVTALVALDKKGRFLSAGRDLTVRLWDSRFNCKDDLNAEAGNIPEPLTLLATFDNPDGRWVRCLGVLIAGSFVRPTDDVDAAMLAAVAKKTAMEGAASAQRAAIQREIIECSGTFATASRNGHNANIWEITAVKKKAEYGSNNNENHKNVAEINLAHVLTHESSIQALATMRDKIVTGDVIGEVFLWEPKRASLFSGKNWINTRVFTPWKDRGLHSPEELSKQAILNLCFLEEENKFVSGSNNGTIRVWDISGSKRGDVVHKRKANSVKVTSEPLSGIQKLPSVKDPNTGEECLAFTVASTDGRVVSMALYHSNSSRHARNELVIFEMNDYSDKGGDDSKTENAIHSIAVSEAAHPGENSNAPTIIAGDDSGSIHLSEPLWSAGPES